jgi:hypothetical protein
VLGAGALTAVDQQPAPTRPAPAAPASPTAVAGAGAAGATASARVVAENELVVELGLEIAVPGTETGRGDTNGPSEPEQLRLVDLRGRGFALRLLGSSTPLVLGEVGRFGSGRPYVVPLRVGVVVVDCSVEVNAPRALRLSLRRGAGPAGPVLVQADPAVVRALDDLVRRSCRRSGG